VQRAIDAISNDLKRLAEKNVYSLEYLLSKPVLGAEKKKALNGSGIKAVTGSDPDGDVDMDNADGDEGEGEGEWIGLDD
jgi:periodic tryptophan protein 2